MIGQEKLQSWIKNIKISDISHSLLLIGDKGCGKHLFSTMISSKLGLDVVDITECITYEYIEDIYQKALPAVYVINASEISEKQQNAMLKFIEEPLSTCYIVILTNNKSELLPTVINRCFPLEFERYTNEELNQFININDDNKDLVLSVCRTPGKLLNVDSNSIKNCFDLCNKMIDKLNVANYANTLTISDKINYKDEYDKVDTETFFNIFEDCLLKRYIFDLNVKLIDLYKETVKFHSKLKDSRLNKQYLVDNYLTSIWKLSRKEK